MRLTVRIRNILWKDRHLYACPIPEYMVFTGDVIEPKPKHLSENQFAISAPGTAMNYRVIEKHLIVDGKRWNT